MRNQERARQRLAEIHAHLARSEQFRGYRPLLVLLTGAVGLAGALLQPQLVPAGAPRAFVAFWTFIALANIGLTAGLILFHYGTGAGEPVRRQTRAVFGQAMPPLAAAGLATAGLTLFSPAQIPLLPGLWCLFFALGIFATLPFVPRRVGWSGVWYLIAGELLLMMSDTPVPLTPWAMGIAFGVGQVFGAILFQTSMPEVTDEEAEA